MHITARKKGSKMRKIIIGIPGCGKCKMLKELCPQAEYIEVKPQDILFAARELKLTSMPFAVITGDVEELAKQLKD